MSEFLQFAKIFAPKMSDSEITELFNYFLIKRDKEN